MPIYEYQCEKCHHHHEALQKFSDKPLRECPECGKRALKRLMSAPMFRLAGSGWYETDFKGDKENKRNLVEKDKGEAPTADASAADAKPDKPAAAVAKEPAAKESSSSGESSSKRRVAAKSLVAARPIAKPVAKPVAKPKPRAARPVARKAVRKR